MKKNLPWIIGAALILIYFAVFETLAFIDPGSFNTLSHFVSSIGAAWPFSIFLAGAVFGGLGVHFYWSWPQNPLNGGG